MKPLFPVLVLLATTVAFLAACPLPGKDAPPPNRSIPFELRYPDGDQSVRWFDGERQLYLTSGNFKFPNTDTWLYFTKGTWVGDGFEASKLLVGRIGESSWFKDADMLLEPCRGKVSIAKDGVRFDVSGSADCEAYHGHFRPVTKSSAPALDACTRYAACACALVREWTRTERAGSNPFPPICANATELLLTAEDAASACRSGLTLIAELAKEWQLSPNECQ